MKILIVQPTGDKKGHYGIWTVRMCQELARQGHNVILCTNKVYPERFLREDPLFEIVEVAGGKHSFEKFDRYEDSQLRFYYGYYKNSYVVTSAGLELANDRDVDVVFLTDIEFMVASLLLKKYRRNDIPVVMHINAANFSFDTYVGTFLKKSYKVLQRGIFKSTLGKEIQALVVLGQWHRKRLRNQLNLPDDFPIEVIPDAADASPSMIGKDQARRQLGIGFDGPIFLFFGVLRRDKGIEHLIESLTYLREDDFRLIIAGSPMEYTAGEIRNLVEQLKVQDKVVLKLNYIDDENVPLWYSACDVTVLPYSASYSGGSGPLMKGSCTYRRPVIATNVSELGRLVREYNLGLIAEPDNPWALAEKMREFISMSEKEREAMTQNVSDLAKSDSWEALGKRYSQFYEKIVCKISC